MTHPQSPLGVGRYEVTLRPYHSQWPQLFEREKMALMEVLGHLPVYIEHVGSTAVPGLCAKPALDILIGGQSMAQLAQAIPNLERMGYMHKPKSSTPGHIFMAKGLEDARTHYLHLLRHQSLEWQKYIYFRDYLIQHPQKQQEYARLKEDLARRFPNNRAKYTNGKQAFINKALKACGLDVPRP